MIAAAERNNIDFIAIDSNKIRQNEFKDTNISK